MNYANLFLILPLILPLVSALICFLPWGRSQKLRLSLLFGHLISSLGLLYFTLTQGVLAHAVGDWMAPYGIILIADPFAALLLATASIIFISCLWDFQSESSYSHPLLFFLQAGVTLSFITGDLFNLFVSFEIMLMASYALMALHARRGFRTNIFSYLLVNITASFLFLVAIAAFYGHTGSLNFAALVQHFQENTSDVAWMPALAVLLVMFVKAGIFPFYFWLPDNYPVLPPRLTALMGGTLSKVGVYCIFRLWIMTFPDPATYLTNGMLIFASATMLFGVLGAVSRATIQSILCYHIISQVGYILFAGTLSTQLAVAAGIFFIIHNMVVKTSLLLLGGIATEVTGKHLLKDMGGLWSSHPFLSILFLVQALALAGLPPLSGFWAKYLLFFEGVGVGAYLSVAIGLITSLFTLFSMVKIWSGAFQGDSEEAKVKVAASSYYGPAALAVIALCMGIMAQYSIRLCQEAAGPLIEKRPYVTAALSTGTKGRAL